MPELGQAEREELIKCATETLKLKGQKQKQAAEHDIEEIVSQYRLLEKTDVPRLRPDTKEIKDFRKAVDDLLQAIGGLNDLSVKAVFGHSDEKEEEEEDERLLAEPRRILMLWRRSALWWETSLSGKLVKRGHKEVRLLPWDRGGAPAKLNERHLVAGCFSIFNFYRFGTRKALPMTSVELMEGDDLKNIPKWKPADRADFRAFVSILYELATGKAEEDLESSVRYVLKVLKASQ